MTSEADADLRQQNLGGLLRDIKALARESEQLSIHNIRETVGERSFGPFLTIPALIEISPIGGIPGLPSVIALVVSFFAIQIVFGRTHIWLPDWLEKRKISGRKLERGIEKIEPASQWIDKVVPPTNVLGNETTFSSGAGGIVYRPLCDSTATRTHSLCEHFTDGSSSSHWVVTHCARRTASMSSAAVGYRDWLRSVQNPIRIIRHG